VKPLLPAFFLGVGLSTANITPAAAYPVDCAILLCLAGGWPASMECAQAYTVFIARITPWPVEPPLQIWNCPMKASLRREALVEHFLDVALRQNAAPKFTPLPDSLLLPVADQADIDISDPAYDFVRSIHVYQIEFRQHRNSDCDCNQSSIVRLGTYGEQGDYNWSNSSTDNIPEASAFSPLQNCNDYSFRSVFIDWRDYEGNYGFEEVRY
jgi:hypothetical protein